MFPILSCTHNEYVLKISSLLKKGAQHASLLYQEFFRKGTLEGKDPHFLNAKNLLQDILNHTSYTLPSLIDTREEGITGKFLLKTHDHLEIESVLIPMQSGGTLCVSSQVGCRMGCAFCETGKMGLIRNLTVEEIISQAFIARHILKFDFKNVVFMGMGEPFDNYDQVMKAFYILNDPMGFNLGRKNITISTSGKKEGIEKLIKEGRKGPNLAVSINAPDNLRRNRLMPTNKTDNMESLYQVMQRYCQEIDKEILIAYVLIQDLNDSLKDAQSLSNYLKGLKVKINLIPYNPMSRGPFLAPKAETVALFGQFLKDLGYKTLIRQTKGQKIMAACGQLGNLNLKKSLRLV
jgi:23S rRNA (adenine2503-C2)-methyltransferase